VAQATIDGSGANPRRVTYYHASGPLIGVIVDGVGNPAVGRMPRVGIECRNGGTGGGNLDDITLNLICTDLILMPGMVLDNTASASRNNIADVAITIAGRLVEGF